MTRAFADLPQIDQHAAFIRCTADLSAGGAIDVERETRLMGFRAAGELVRAFKRNSGLAEQVRGIELVEQPIPEIQPVYHTIEDLSDADRHASVIRCVCDLTRKGHVDIKRETSLLGAAIAGQLAQAMEGTHLDG